MDERNEIKLSDVANADRNKMIRKPSHARPPAPVNMRRTLSANSSEILEEVYEALGGTQGSQMYWRNHEEQFRTMVEAKFLTKQVLKETASAQAQEIGKNIFMTFIQNNGLQKEQPMPQVEATIVNPELEDKQ